MNRLRDIAAEWLAAGRAALLVEVARTRGSAPREAGARMIVDGQASAGSIGGGHLELQAIAHARRLLTADRVDEDQVRYPLGPALGQCCGGEVTLRYVRLDTAALRAWPLRAPRFHLQLHGAGHVGRAIAHALAPLPVHVDWIDEREDAFGTGLDAAAWPPHLRRRCVDAPHDEVAHAPTGAYYLVLTHRHDLDLLITEAVLRRGDFGFLGLIGSRSKRQRFVHRLEQRGLAGALLERITCPIGVPGVAGKEPEVIAAAVVAQLLQQAPQGAAPGDQSTASARNEARSRTLTV